MSTDYETDVLIVGSGPAGSSAAALLSSYGIRNMMVSRFGWLADTPRAHITNQRTMEVLRDLGLEREAVSVSSGQNLMATMHALGMYLVGATTRSARRITSWPAPPPSATFHRPIWSRSCFRRHPSAAPRCE